jgi:hypothetical protein
VHNLKFLTVIDVCVCVCVYVGVWEGVGREDIRPHSPIRYNSRAIKSVGLQRREL